MTHNSVELLLAVSKLARVAISTVSDCVLVKTLLCLVESVGVNIQLPPHIAIGRIGLSKAVTNRPVMVYSSSTG
jgi:hypothetical protein